MRTCVTSVIQSRLFIAVIIDEPDDFNWTSVTCTLGYRLLMSLMTSVTSVILGRLFITVISDEPDDFCNICNVR